MTGHSDTIANLYAAFARGDVPTVLAAFAPNISWTEAEGFPYGGTYWVLTPCCKMSSQSLAPSGSPSAPAFLKTPTVAIDLPPKAIVWEDANGKVFLSYNSAEYLFGTIYARHGAARDKGMTAKLEAGLKAISDEATK